MLPSNVSDLNNISHFKNFLDNLQSCHEHSFSDEKKNDLTQSYQFFLEYIENVIKDENPSFAIVQNDFDFMKIEIKKTESEARKLNDL